MRREHLIWSDNGLATNRREAAVWTNDNHDLWQHMASLDQSELNQQAHKGYDFIVMCACQ